MRSDEAIMTAVRQTRSDAAALKKALMLIGGKWVESASGEVLEVEDPAHRRPVAEIPRGRVEDVARAVNAAAEAFPAWSRMIPHCTSKDPRPVQHGGRVGVLQTPDLFAPADDRNALATPTAGGIALAS